MNRTVTIASCLLLFAFATACERDSEARTRTGDPATPPTNDRPLDRTVDRGIETMERGADKLRESATEAKQALERTYSEQMNALGDQMAELDRKAENASAEAKQKWAETKSDLAARKAKAEAELQRLRNAGADGWEEAKADAKKAFESFREGVDKAMRDLGAK